MESHVCILTDSHLLLSNVQMLWEIDRASLIKRIEIELV